MTDYLEFQEEGVDALWEAARRLDDVLTGAEERKPSRAREADGTESASGLADIPIATGEGLLPLRTAAAELDGVAARAGMLRIGGDAAAAGQGYQNMRELSAPWDDGVRSRIASASVDPMSWGTESGQAERLDLLFRRDSRRYDGGFFLY